MPPKDYPEPPKPKVGDRVHKSGLFPYSGTVRVVLDEYEDFWVAIVAWFKPVNRPRWSLMDRGEWQWGLWRPGPCPKPDKDGKYPWNT